MRLLSKTLKLLLFFLLLNTLVSAQQNPIPSSIDNETVTFTRLIEEMEKAQKWTIIKETKIRFQHAIDKDGMDKWWSEGNHPIKINANIGLYNCDFDEEFWLVLRDITFDGYVSFINCKNLKIIFQNCHFKKTLRMNSNETEFITLNQCNFDLGYKFERGNVTDKIKLFECNFNINDKLLLAEQKIRKDFDVNDYVFQVSSRANPLDLEIEKCKFFVPESIRNKQECFIRLSQSKFGGLKLINSTFDGILDLSETSVENQFTTRDCIFKGNLLFDGLNINQSNSYIDWNTISSKKIAIYDDIQKRVVTGNNFLEHDQANYFSELISCYSNIYYIFKNQGNRFSANQCYIEWKDLETKYQLFLAEAKGENDSYIIYLMNVFLRDFCDYGTNPIKAIINSSYVILIFSVIYFISPVSIENLPKRSFYSQAYFYFSYLNSDKSFKTHYHEYKSKFQIAQFEDEMLEYLKSNTANTPIYLNIFKYKPSFNQAFSKFEYFIFSHILNKNKAYQDLTFKQKLNTGIAIFFILLVNAFYFITIKAFDSLILSINAFSTLGFGELKVVGIGIYLTVIEGFIGWFLLSIFSVALLNQLIQ